MSEPNKPATDSNISTPEGLLGDAAHKDDPKHSKGDRTKDKEQSAEIADQIAAAIGQGDFKTALALSVGAPGIPSALIAQAQQGLEAQLNMTGNNTPTPDTKVSAAPTPGKEQNVEQAPAPDLKAEAPGQGQERINMTELRDKAADTTAAFEAGLKFGAAYSAAARKAVKDKLPDVAEAGKSTDQMLASLSETAVTELRQMVRKGAMGVLWDGTAKAVAQASSNVVDIGGTGNFVAAGNLAPPSMSLADTNVIAANKDPNVPGHA